MVEFSVDDVQGQHIISPDLRDRSQIRNSSMKNVKLDRFDRRILRVLQKEGRITKVGLADRVGLSPTPCWERMKRLEKEGIILGYRAQIDVDRISPRQYYYVELKLEDYVHDRSDFEAYVCGNENIIECHAVLSKDYIMLVAARTNEELEKILMDGARHINNPAKATTRPVVRAVKTQGWQRALPES